jgi:hypothetical protein
MLVENQERATINRLLFGCVDGAAYQSPKDLIMAEKLRYEQRSNNTDALNGVQGLF